MFHGKTKEALRLLETKTNDLLLQLDDEIDTGDSSPRKVRNSLMDKHPPMSQPILSSLSKKNLNQLTPSFLNPWMLSASGQLPSELMELQDLQVLTERDGEGYVPALDVPLMNYVILLLPQLDSYAPVWWTQRASQHSWPVD